MSNNLITLAALRVSEANPNHHLWNNNGTWFIHYTVHQPDFTKARVRRSLRTRRLETALQRRDAWLSRVGDAHPCHPWPFRSRPGAHG